MKHNTWQLLENAILETLEHRQMMSATPLVAPAALQNGVLTVNQDGSKSTTMIIDFNRDRSRIQVRAAGYSEALTTSLGAAFLPSVSRLCSSVAMGTLARRGSSVRHTRSRWRRAARAASSSM